MAWAWYERGNALDDLQRHAEELVAYDCALAINPDSAEIWIDKSLSLARRGRHTEALAAVERALALNQNSQRAWEHKLEVQRDLERAAGANGV
jgi:tetratricopeptide (TPR) repeat protein